MKSLHKIAKQQRNNKHNILNSIIYRWSPRSMSGKAVSNKELMPLFEAARWAPSSNNNQEWFFYYALKNTNSFKNLFQILNSGNQEWCKNAGVLMILVSQKLSDYKDKPIRTHAFDTGAAFEAFAIEGLRRNLVIHPMGGFDLTKATKYLKLNTDRLEIQCMIAVGKPGKGVGKEEVKGRKPISKIVNKL